MGPKVYAEQMASSVKAHEMLQHPAVRTKRRYSWKTALVAYVFLLPTLIAIALFSYYPAASALLGAFTNWNGFNPPQWVGLQNFAQAFQDPIFLESAKNLLIWSLVGLPLSLVPSFVVAELIFHLRSTRAQYVYRTVFVLSFVIPSVVTILIWQYIYEPTGLLNHLLISMGLQSWTQSWIADPKYALWAVILMGFPWVNPFNLLVYYAGLQSIPVELFDAAAVDGVSRLQRITHIDVPMVLSQIKVLLVLSIVGVTQNIVVPLIMTDGGPGNSTTTPVFYMYEQAIQYGNYGYSMAIALMLFVVVMALALVNIKYFQAER
ncbi:MAG: carbohydrate ABC transporter permease [Bacilli bacterium]